MPWHCIVNRKQFKRCLYKNTIDLQNGCTQNESSIFPLDCVHRRVLGCKAKSCFLSLMPRIRPLDKTPLVLKKCQSKNSGMMGFVQHICFSHTVLPFPSSLSLLILGTSGAHFSVCLINPFLVFHILFQSFLYIIVCCLYLLVLHSVPSITQFVFLLFQATWFPWIPFWILVALLFLSISTWVISFWLLILLFRFNIYFTCIISQNVHNSTLKLMTAIMILIYLLSV